MQVRFGYGLLEHRDKGGNGLGELCEKVRQTYPAIKTYINEWNDDWEGLLESTMHEAPHIIVVHSYAMAKAIQAIKRLQKQMSIFKLIAIDGVPRWLDWQWQWSSWNLPDNIMLATAYYQNNQTIPRSCLIRNPRRGWNNIDLTKDGVNHATICHSATVWNDVVASIDLAKRMETVGAFQL